MSSQVPDAQGFPYLTGAVMLFSDCRLYLDRIDIGHRGEARKEGKRGTNLGLSRIEPRVRGDEQDYF